MTASSKISFRGATYVKVEAATKHEKCKPGTHWNVKLKKCLKLPKRLNYLSKDAHKFTATDPKLLAKRNEAPLSEVHARGASAHNEAALEADRLGFKDLAKEHRKHQKNHGKLSDHHSRAEAKAEEK